MLAYYPWIFSTVKLFNYLQKQGWWFPQGRCFLLTNSIFRGFQLLFWNYFFFLYIKVTGFGGKWTEGLTSFSSWICVSLFYKCSVKKTADNWAPTDKISWLCCLNINCNGRIFTNSHLFYIYQRIKARVLYHSKMNVLSESKKWFLLLCMKY